MLKPAALATLSLSKVVVPLRMPFRATNIKSRTLLCMFLVRPLAGKAGQRPHQKNVLWGRRSRPPHPHQPIAYVRKGGRCYNTHKETRADQSIFIYRRRAMELPEFRNEPFTDFSKPENAAAMERA